jgi:hypothetical protein
VIAGANERRILRTEEARAAIRREQEARHWITLSRCRASVKIPRNASFLPVVYRTIGMKSQSRLHNVQWRHNA